MAIRKVKLNLPPGTITAITGPNSNGKSCIARAIEAFVKNESGKTFIRSGALVARVGIKPTEDSEVYFWERNLSKAFYRVGKSKKESLNRTSISELVPESGFVIEKDLSQVIVPNIVHEKTPMFPFNVSSASVFKIFNRFLGNQRLETIISELKDNLKKDKKSLTELKGSISTYDEEIISIREKLRHLPAISKLIYLRKSIADKRASLRKYSSSFVSIDEKVNEFQRLFNLSKSISRNVQDLAGIGPANPTVETYRELERASIKINNNINTLKAVNAEIKNLGSKKKANLDNIKDKISMYKNMESLLCKSNTYDGLLRIIKKDTVIKSGINDKLSSFDYCPLCERPF